MTALANTFVINSDVTVATSALARIKFVENSLKAISTTDEKISAGLQEATKMLAEYKQALGKLIENSKEIDDLTTEMADSATAIAKAAGAMKAGLVADQQRLEATSDATIARTERLIVMLAAGGFLLGAVLALLLGKGISRPMTAMCKAMRELASGHFDVVLPGLGRKGRTWRNGRRGRTVQAAGRRQGGTRCRRAGSPEQGQQRRAPQRTDPVCR